MNAIEFQNKLNMNEEKIARLRNELADLLEKYNVRIVFTCGDNSDTHGLYNDHIAIQEKGTDIDVIVSEDWSLSARDLKQ